MKTILKYIIPSITVFGILIYSFICQNEIDSTTTVSLVTIALTYFYVVFTWEMAVNMKQDSELERRPYIIPDFFIINHNSLIFHIINYGKTPAFEVTVNIDPDIKMGGGRKLSDDMFGEPIHIIPPNREIKTSVGFSKQIFQDEKFPKKYKIYISYKNTRGKIYNETYTQDIDYMKHETYVARKDIDDIGRELVKLNKTLKEMK